FVTRFRSSGSRLTANPIAPTRLQASAVSCRLSGSADAALDGGASTLRGRTMILYPTPGTVTRNRAAFGSGSILRRSRATSMSMLRSKGSVPRPTTAWRNFSRDSTWQGLLANAFSRFDSARVRATSRPQASTKTQPAKSSLQSSIHRMLETGEDLLSADAGVGPEETRLPQAAVFEV